VLSLLHCFPEPFRCLRMLILVAVLVSSVSLLAKLCCRAALLLLNRVAACSRICLSLLVLSVSLLALSSQPCCPCFIVFLSRAEPFRCLRKLSLFLLLLVSSVLLLVLSCVAASLSLLAARASLLTFVADCSGSRWMSLLVLSVSLLALAQPCCCCYFLRLRCPVAAS
jgi:hypothetical protein